jgi:hypothetical protein
VSRVRNILTDLMDAAAVKGATVCEKGDGHYQIRGRLLVNYYPFSRRRTAYVAATTHGKEFVSPTEAVSMAFAPPPVVNGAKKDHRKGKPRAKRAALILRNGPHCHWCKCEVTLETSTIEHVIPLNRGGLDNPNNRVLACYPCNKGRGHNMPELAK